MSKILVLGGGIVGLSTAGFYIQDKRRGGTALLGAMGAAHPLSGGSMVDRAAKANRITVTVFLPQCVENCQTHQPVNAH